MASEKYLKPSELPKYVLPLVDYSKQYLTFTALENTTFKFSNALQYSLDDGNTWNTLTANTNTTTITAGNKILWKQIGLTPTSSNGIGTFSATGNFEVSGNIMSLYYGDNFIGQTNLTGKNYAFLNLFYNCNKLVNAENLILSSTTLAPSCYYNMFLGCSSLTEAPELLATTLAPSCYYNMFRGCSSLTEAPELPATTLASSCYYGMFQGCTSLTTAPELPATILKYGCYSYMFMNCTSLTTAPELPATTLANYCYNSMFCNCTSLISAPELPATTLTDGCYTTMFQNCISLKYIKCLATNISVTNCTTNWVNGVSDTGTFVKADSMSSWTTGNNGIPSGWTVYTESEWKEVRHYELDNIKPIHDYSKDYLTIEALEYGRISFIISSGINTDLLTSISYSVDNGNTWITTNNTNNKNNNIQIDVYVNEGDKVLWKGIASALSDEEENISSFISDIEVNVEGNIMSLLYGDNFINQTSLPTNIGYIFCNVFGDYVNDGTNVINAKNLVLPATTLADSCYSYMFSGCTSLITTPELPATILTTSCYDSMFANCTSLIAAPKLLATTLADHCYASMFQGCTSLITTPELSITTLTSYCYQNMFYGCTSLTAAPELPATTLAQYCYAGMFWNCTSLTKAPELPATKLASCCYKQMFYGCTSLTTAPELPATTLAKECYQQMFNGCTSLTKAPELPATTLADYCYAFMFYGCTKLNYIKCLATNISANSCTVNWVSNVAASGTFVKADNMTSWTTGNNGIPSGWTVYTESNWKEVKQYELKKYIFKGTCSTASATTAKDVVCPEFTSSDLVKGAIIFVTFDNTNSGAVASITMNVNGTGAKPIKKQYNTNGAANLISARELAANSTYMFQYNGTYWVCMTLDYYANDPNFELRHYYSVTTKNALPQYTLSFLDTEIGQLIPFNSQGGNGASNKTMTTEEFDPFSEILYHTNTAIAAGGTTNGDQLYYTYELINLQYTFNLPNTSQFTAREPVYIVCELQSSGKAKLVSPYYTKDLPTTNDGKLYIFLGIAHDGYRVELWQDHPIYYHNGTSLQKYGNSGISSNGLSTEKYYLVGNTSDNTSILYRYNTNGPYMKGAQLYSGSDINYKTDIMPISDNFVNQLFERTDITYDFKWKDTNKDSSGFIAQWIEDIMPEVVDGSDETKHVNYDAALSKVVGAMFKKIQEQQKEIDELKIIITQKGEA